MIWRFVHDGYPMGQTGTRLRPREHEYFFDLWKHGQDELPDEPLEPPVWLVAAVIMYPLRRDGRVTLHAQAGLEGHWRMWDRAVFRPKKGKQLIRTWADVRMFGQVWICRGPRPHVGLCVMSGAGLDDLVGLAQACELTGANVPIL